MLAFNGEEEEGVVESDNGSVPPMVSSLTLGTLESNENGH